MTKMCVKCGVEKPALAFSPDPKRRTPAGRKKRRPYCKACDNERAREYRARRPTCPNCGKQRPIHTGFYYWRDSRTGKNRPSRLCRVCIRERQRERYQRIMADPYTRKRERDRKREFAGRRERENAERCRRYRKRLKADRPDVYRQQLEDARIRNKANHERAGGTLKPATNWTPGSRVYLDPTPLLSVFVREADDPVLARAMRRIQTGQSAHIELGIADAMALYVGVPLTDFYPELAA